MADCLGQTSRSLPSLVRTYAPACCGTLANTGPVSFCDAKGIIRCNGIIPMHYDSFFIQIDNISYFSGITQNFIAG